MPKQSHGPCAPLRFICHGMFWAHQEGCRNDQSSSRFGRKQKTGVAELSFPPSPLFPSQLLLEGDDFLLKQDASKPQVKPPSPIRSSFFVPQERQRSLKTPLWMVLTPGSSVCIKHNYEWLHTSFLPQAGANQISSDYIRVVRPTQRPPVSTLLNKETIKECKIQSLLGIICHCGLVGNTLA